VAMIRVYARENATQRGLSSTALTGTVASAMKYIAKGIVTGAAQAFLRDFDLPAGRGLPTIFPRPPLSGAWGATARARGRRAARECHTASPSLSRIRRPSLSRFPRPHDAGVSRVLSVVLPPCSSPPGPP